VLKTHLFDKHSKAILLTMPKFQSVAVLLAIGEAARVAVKEHYNATGGGKGWGYAPSAGAACSAGSLCGPNEWHKVPLSPRCSDVGNQSPIDIVTSNLKDPPSSLNVDLDFIDAKLPICGEPDDYAVAKGTALTLPPECQQSMMFEDKRYNLLQFHYHSPSEHTVNGKYYPLEVHHVHKAADGEVAVIAVLVQAGEPEDDDVRRAKFLDDVMDIDGYDADDDDVHEDEEEDEKMRMAKMDPYTNFIPPIDDGDGRGFYYYKGSFTTPPCSIGVNWIISKQVVTVPAAIIEGWRTGASAIQHHWANFGTIVGGANRPRFAGQETYAGSDDDDDDDELGMDWKENQHCNNRPIQSTGSRHVYDVN